MMTSSTVYSSSRWLPSYLTQLASLSHLVTQRKKKCSPCLVIYSKISKPIVELMHLKQQCIIIFFINSSHKEIFSTNRYNFYLITSWTSISPSFFTLMTAKTRLAGAPDVVTDGGREFEEQEAVLVVKRVTAEIEVTCEGDEIFSVTDKRIFPSRVQQHWERRTGIKLGDWQFHILSQLRSVILHQGCEAGS